MRLNVLGSLEVVGEDGSAPTGSPQQRALLALLAMYADRPVSAASIIDRLWAEPPASAANTVQIHVSHLRRVLEPGRRRGQPAHVLVSVPGGYTLRTDSLELDVALFARLLTDGRAELDSGRVDGAARLLAEALALFRGPAYAEVAHEDWAQAEVSRIEQLRLDAVERLAQALLGLGRLSEVVDLLEPLVSDHPLRERGWEMLARAHYRAGRQGDALEALRRVRGVLADELGVDPGQALRDLEVAILRQDPGLLPEPATVAGLEVALSSRAADPVDARFVGRADALAELESARRASLEATLRGTVVLVDGEPGIGKSTLVRHFVDGLSVPTGWGASPDHGTAPPLWPWEEVLRGLAVHADGAMADLFADPKAAVAGQARGALVRLAEHVRDLLESHAPLVVALDDLHAADESSLAVLRTLAGRLPRGVLLVGTYRTHETAGLTATLAALARQGARRLHLAGFDASETRSLVESLTGSDPGAERAAGLAERAAGNPFFIGELARSPEDLPLSVREVVRDRVATLDPAVGELLRLAAVVGGEFDALLLAEVSGRDIDEVVPLLDRATAAGLVRESRQHLGGYAFSHALVTDALLSDTSRLRRAREHERIATVAETLWAGRRDRLGDIARHWLGCSDLGSDQAAKAVHFAAEAAREADRRQAPADATRSWQEAIAAAELAGSDAETRWGLALGLVRSLYHAGRYTEGYAAVVHALDLADADPVKVVGLCDVAMTNGTWLPFRYGEPLTALRTALELALDRLRPEQPEHALGQACQAVVLAQVGCDDRVEAVSRAAVDAAARHHDEALLLRALHLRLVALRGADHGSSRAGTAEEILARPGAPPWLAAAAELHLVTRLIELGDTATARRRLVELEERVRDLHDPTIGVQTSLTHLALDLFQGRPVRPDQVPPELEPVLAEADRDYFEMSLGSLQAIALFEAHALGPAVEQLEHLAEVTTGPGFAYGLGLALEERGEIERARRILTGTLPPPRDYTWPTTTVARLHLAMRLDALDLVHEIHADLVPFADQLVVGGTTTTVMGAYAGHLGEASLALGRPDRARVELGQAVELLERAGAAYWLDRARQALDKALSRS